MSAKITFSFEGTQEEFFDFIQAVQGSIPTAGQKSSSSAQIRPVAKIERKEENKELPLFEGGRSDPLTPDLQKSVQSDVQVNKGSRYNFPREYGEKVEIPPATSYSAEVALLWHNFMQEFSAGIVDDRPHPQLPRDRVALVTELSSNKLHGKLLQEIVAVGGLQCAIRNILSTEGQNGDRVFLKDEDVNKIAGVLVQISHVALPELADIYDYSSKWRIDA